MRLNTQGKEIADWGKTKYCQMPVWETDANADFAFYEQSCTSLWSGD